MKWGAIGLVIIVLSFVLTIYYYPLLPKRIAIHWNIEGPDRYVNKIWLFSFPLFSIGLWLLFLLIPRIDPLKKNVKKFQSVYEKFCVLTLGFMFYVTTFVVYANLYVVSQAHYFVIPAVAIILYACGELCKYAKRNWFIGIRTPWTLSSDYVWKRTHKQGEKLFKFASILLILSLIIDYFTKSGEIIYFTILLIIATACYLILYSYLIYAKRNR